jgi:serine/threonine-protein kinase
MKTIEQKLANAHYFSLVTILLAVVMMGIYIFFVSLLFRYGTQEKDLGWKCSPSENFYIITQINPNSDAAGKLQLGDKILSLNEDNSIQKNYIILGSFINTTRKIPINSTYTIEISRNQIPYKFTLTCKSKKNYEQLVILVTFLFCSLIFSVCGFLLGILKPEIQLTRQLGLVFFFTAMFMLGNSARILSNSLEGLDYLFLCILLLSYPTFFPLAYGAYLQFPPGVIQSRVWNGIKYFLYVYSAIILLVRLASLLNINQLAANSTLIKQLLNTDFLLSFLDKAWALLILLTVILLISITIRNYNKVSDIDQRRRIKWVAYASIVGLVPLLITHSITALLNPATHKYVISTYSYFLFARFGELCITTLPLSFVYVVVKHQVFDINVVVRRGLQYLLAKNVLRIILALELVGMIAIVQFNPNLTIRELFSPKSAYLYIVAISIVSFIYQTQISSWLDKVFFRKAYNTEQVLVNLIEKLKSFNSINEISQAITSTLEEVLHPKSIYFFYRSGEKESLTLGSCSGNPSKIQKILDSSDLVQLMESNPVTQDLNFINALPEEEKQWINALQAQLIVPIVGQNKDLVGLFLLGEKLSDEPYSKNDCKLLEAMASQLGIVYENNLLKEKVAKESKIKQEILSKLEDQNINLVKECPECNRCFDSDKEVCDLDKTKLELSLPVERVINGKYRLDKMIGKGGMGAVYSATDLRLERIVAVKILHGSMFGDQEAIKRFEREARASAKLAHPNIVAVYDYGKLVASGAYLTMELVSGITLGEKLLKEQKLSPKLVAELFDQILDAIEVAHKANIIHRDLKPDNILLFEDNGKTKVKILDFGIAKIKRIDSIDPNSLTAPGTVIGTFGYMPPEQFSAEEVDERSDIFALGVIAIEALTGEKPFDGRTVYELMGNMLRKSYNLPDSCAEAKELDKVLQKCIAKDPTKRFSSIKEMKVELIPAIYQCPETAFTEY